VVVALLHLPPPAHGASLKNQRMLDGAVARLVDFRVIRCQFAADLEDLGRFSTRKVARAGWYLLRLLVRLVRDRPDAGYMMATTAGPGLVRDAIYMNVFRLWRTPYVVHVPMLGLPGSVAGRPALRRLVARGLGGAAAVITLHDGHRDELAGLVPGARVVVVENGLPDVVPPSVEPAERPTVLFLSNLRAGKGLFTLLDALAAVVARVPTARARIAGPWQDPATEARFRDVVDRRGLADHVEHVGPVYGEDKLRFLASGHVFAFPSHQDNAPNVVLEAMRQALPVVATRVGGVPFMVADGVTGRLVPPGDAEALAAALVELLADPARAAEMGQAGRARFEQRFAMTRWEAEMSATIRDAADRTLPVEAV
jgi:glycosyltransferase involved in cell wall biosynthesis